MMNISKILTMKIISIVLICASLTLAQDAVSPTTADIFFLDLGIVIEPSTGNESYSRFVQNTSDEVKIRIKKAESGSVYMAASKEMLAALQRIQTRMEELEVSFQSEIHSLKDENHELRGILADYHRPPIQQPSRPKIDISSVEEDLAILKEVTTFDKTPPMKTVPKMKEPEKAKATIIKPAFSSSDYMAGVMAYQKEDYKEAIRQFLNLDLSKTDIPTAANILYWVADAHQQLGDYVTAITILDQLLRIPKSERTDDALIQKGLLYRKTGREDLALETFSTVVNQYPDSDYLRLAKLELKKAELIP